SVENYIKTNEIPDDENKDLIIQFSKIKFDGVLESEYQCYSEKDLLAGTIDLKENIDVFTSNIYDIKTSKKIEKENKYNSFMLKPLEHLANTNLQHFYLQTNLYRYILEQMGLWVEKIEIFHINYETNKIDIYPVKFVTDEITEMLKYYKLNQEIEDFI
ncbi:MAG: hypothetical protein AABY22_21985, partial [Nanoarchaeota archaeon]